MQSGGWSGGVESIVEVEVEVWSGGWSGGVENIVEVGVEEWREIESRLSCELKPI